MPDLRRVGERVEIRGSCGVPSRLRTVSRDIAVDFLGGSVRVATLTRPAMPKGDQDSRAVDTSLGSRGTSRNEAREARNEQSFRNSLFLANQCVKSFRQVGGSSGPNPRVEAEGS